MKGVVVPIAALVVIALTPAACAPPADVDAGLDASIDAGMDASVDAGPRPDSPRPWPIHHDASCPGDADFEMEALLAPGSFRVGVRTVLLTDAARGRDVPIELWYPVDAAAPTGAPNVYYLDSPLGTLASLCSPALRDARALAGTRGLVVFSHGFGGSRMQSFFLMELLASWGYVVAAPDHLGNTVADLAHLSDPAFENQSAIDRPLDMMFVVDRMLADGAGLAGDGVVIDPARIAISGHSFGGWTAIETAGRDPRLAVVVALAPGFHDPSSPAIAGELGGRPLLLVGGSVDHTTPLSEQMAAYAAASAPEGLLEITGAGHLDYTALCDVPALVSIVDDGCDPATLDPARVRAITGWLVLRWLRRYLDHDVAVDPELTEASVEGLGVAAQWTYAP